MNPQPVVRSKEMRTKDSITILADSSEKLAGRKRRLTPSSLKSTKNKIQRKESNEKFKKKGPRFWTKEEDMKLKSVFEIVRTQDIEKHKVWSKCAALLPSRSAKECRQRWLQVLNPTIIKGRWTKEEDAKLLNAMQNIDLVTKNGKIAWCRVSDKMGGTRSSKQCRERWLNSATQLTTDTSTFSSAKKAKTISGDITNVNSATPPVATDSNTPAVTPEGGTLQEPLVLPVRNLKLRKGRWTETEEAKLLNVMQNIDLVSKKGKISWDEVSKRMGGTRTGKQCHQSWITRLKPSVREQMDDKKQKEYSWATLVREHQASKSSSEGKYFEITKVNPTAHQATATTISPATGIQNGITIRPLSGITTNTTTPPGTATTKSPAAGIQNGITSRPLSGITTNTTTPPGTANTISAATGIQTGITTRPLSGVKTNATTPPGTATTISPAAGIQTGITTRPLSGMTTNTTTPPGTVTTISPAAGIQTGITTRPLSGITTNTTTRPATGIINGATASPMTGIKSDTSSSQVFNITTEINTPPDVAGLLSTLPLQSGYSTTSMPTTKKTYLEYKKEENVIVISTFTTTIVPL